MVIDHQMDAAADVEVRHLTERQRLLDDALAGHSGVAVHLDQLQNETRLLLTRYAFCRKTGTCKQTTRSLAGASASAR